jgi:hypothetical protein
VVVWWWLSWNARKSVVAFTCVHELSLLIVAALHAAIPCAQAEGVTMSFREALKVAIALQFTMDLPDVWRRDFDFAFKPADNRRSQGFEE